MASTKLLSVRDINRSAADERDHVRLWSAVRSAPGPIASPAASVPASPGPLPCAPKTRYTSRARARVASTALSHSRLTRIS